MTPKKSRPTTAFELDYSVEVDGVDVDTLHMRRPTVRDQLSFEEDKGTEGRRVVKLIANLCDVPPKSIEALDGADFERLSEVLKTFRSTQSES